MVIKRKIPLSSRAPQIPVDFSFPRGRYARGSAVALKQPLCAEGRNRR
jgi:hypothetical protein